MNNPFDPAQQPLSGEPAYPSPVYPAPPIPYPSQPYPGQPYPPQAYLGQAYPPPPYPPQPYAGQPYPGQPYPGQPWPGQPWPVPEAAPTPPARTKRRSRLPLVITASAVVAVAAVAALILSGSSSSSPSAGSTTSSTPTAFTGVLPGSFAGYSQLHNAEADRMRTRMDTVWKDLSHGAVKATVGVYAKDSGEVPVLLVVTFPASAKHALAGTQDDFGVVAELMSDVSNHPLNYPAGPHGGAVTCATAQFGVATETVCSWSDARSVGAVYSIRDDTVTPTDLSLVTNELRDRIR